MSQQLSDRIILLVNRLEISSGVSSHLYYLLKGMHESSRSNIILIVGGGSVVCKFERLVSRVIIESDIQHETRSIFGFLRGIFKLRKYIKQFNPVIIHSHHFYAANLVALARFGKNIPTIQTIHGNIPPVGLLKHYWADHYILVSKHLSAQLKSENRSGAVLYSVIPSPFPFPERPPICSEHLHLSFLFAGRLVAEKNLSLFLRTAQLICNEYDKVNFVIAGAGPMSDLAVIASQNPRIRYIGEVDNLAELLSEFDVIVNCSVAKEGFPTIIIQAAAWAKCVVSSKFEGYSDFLSNNNSFLYESHNETDFSNIIRTIIKNPQLIRDKGTQIFNDFRDVFKSDKIAQDLISLYNKMAD